MGPLAYIDVMSAVLIGVVALVVTALSACIALALRAARTRRAQLATELERSRSEVESLSRRVEELSHDVERAGTAAAQEREYVITSLAEAERAELGPRRTSRPTRQGRVMNSNHRPPVGRALEDQLVESLARHQDGSRRRSRTVQLVVRTVSLGHGVRRALAPDNLDRAAAEAHVVRRRSRRVRKRELREARRLLRVVRTREADEDVA